MIKGLSEMVETIVPVWVDPLTVADVPRIAGLEAPPRAVAVNATDNWVGEMYLQRASCGSIGVESLRVKQRGGREDDDDIEQIVRELVEDGRSKVSLPSTASIDDVLARAKNLERGWATLDSSP